MKEASQTCMYRWAKILRTESEASVWEAVIEASGLTNATISHDARGKTRRLEIFDPQRSRLDDWQQQFGGTIERFSAMDIERMSRPAEAGESPLLKIRDCLLVSQSADECVLDEIRKEFPGRIVLSYPPGLAFGTGNHATTSTCLRLIADFAKQHAGESDGREGSWNFLDLGCGSGILSAAAKSLGADQVTGIDFDGMAVRAARQLADRNGLDGTCLMEADVLQWNPRRPHTFNLVAANLFHDVLIELLPRLPAWLEEDGELIVSGILHSQEQNCLSAGERAGFTFGRIIRRGRWVTARAQLA